MKTGIVIVTWNSSRHIEACLEACSAQTVLSHDRILVIDNNSADDTAVRARAFPNVSVIANTINAGFAGAVNQGFCELVDCDVVVVLNPDAQIVQGLSILAAAARQPGVGAAGGLLVNPDGTPQTGFCVRRFPTALSLAFELLGINRLWPGNPINRRYRCLGLDLTRPAEVQQPAGALLAVNRTAWSDVQGFNEEFYPLWFDDVDFLKRIAASGRRILYVPEAKAVHTGGHSLETVSWGDRQLYWYGSLLTYARSHLGLLGRGLVSGAVMLGALPRAIAGISQLGVVQTLGIYGRVLRLAAGFRRIERKPPGGNPIGERRAGGVHSET